MMSKFILRSIRFKGNSIPCLHKNYSIRVAESLPSLSSNISNGQLCARFPQQIPKPQKLVIQTNVNIPTTINGAAKHKRDPAVTRNQIVRKSAIC